MRVSEAIFQIRNQKLRHRVIDALMDSNFDFKVENNLLEIKIRGEIVYKNVIRSRD